MLHFEWVWSNRSSGLHVTYQSRYWNWMIIYWISELASFAGIGQWKCYRCCQKIQIKVPYSNSAKSLYFSFCWPSTMRNGRFQWMHLNAFHPCSVWNVWMEEWKLEIIERPPTISTRCLQEQQLYPSHIHSVQELVPHDVPARCSFCQWTRDPVFRTRVSYIDDYAAPGLGSPTVWMNLCSQMKILTCIDHTTSNDSYV